MIMEGKTFFFDSAPCFVKCHHHEKITLIKEYEIVQLILTNNNNNILCKV